MKLKTSASDLAQDLRVSVDSIRKKWPDLGPDGVGFDRNQVHNGMTWPPFLKHFRDSSRASEYTRTRASELLAGNAQEQPVPIQIETSSESEQITNVKSITQKPQEKPERPIKSSPTKPRSWQKYSKTKQQKKDEETNRGVRIPVVVIALVLLPALVWQMEHYATVVDRYSQIENEITSYVFSWFFAFSVTGTAIVMTAAKGRLTYLYVFAAIETAANILYYLPDTAIKWGTSILLSGAMAFCIFSYSEILAKTLKK